MIFTHKIQSETWIHPPTSIVISDFWNFVFFAQPLLLGVLIFRWRRASVQARGPPSNNISVTDRRRVAPPGHVEHLISQAALWLALRLSRGRHWNESFVLVDSIAARMPEVKPDINITRFTYNRSKWTAFVVAPLFGIILAVVNGFALYKCVTELLSITQSSVSRLWAIMNEGVYVSGRVIFFRGTHNVSDNLRSIFNYLF